MNTMIVAAAVASALGLCAHVRCSGPPPARGDEVRQSRPRCTADQLCANTVWHAAAIPGVSFANADRQSPYSSIDRDTDYA